MYKINFVSDPNLRVIQTKIIGEKLVSDIKKIKISENLESWKDSILHGIDDKASWELIKLVDSSNINYSNSISNQNLAKNYFGHNTFQNFFDFIINSAFLSHNTQFYQPGFFNGGYILYEDIIKNSNSCFHSSVTPEFKKRVSNSMVYEIFTGSWENYHPDALSSINSSTIEYGLNEGIDFVRIYFEKNYLGKNILDYINLNSLAFNYDNCNNLEEIILLRNLLHNLNKKKSTLTKENTLVFEAMFKAYRGAEEYLLEEGIDQNFIEMVNLKK